MRTIKYRAWLRGDHDGICDDGQTQGVGFGTGSDATGYVYSDKHKFFLLKDGHYYDGVMDVEFPTIIIEQYTGLDDKNGVPIYEGDIIQETILADDTTDGTYRYEVYWNEDMLCWSIKGISDIDYHLRDDLWETNASREVIGNIHEPPKDFRPEHLKRMGVSISKGGEE